MQYSASAPRRLIGTGLAALSLASLAAAVTAPAASATARATSAPGTAARAAQSARLSQWHVRTVLRESTAEQIATQVVDPRAGVDYALVPRTAAPAGPAGPYRLQRTDLATGAVRRGPVFTVTGLTLADGYLWVSGAVPAGSAHYRLRLYQVNPGTLTVIRSRQLRLNADDGFVGVSAGPGQTVWVGFLGRLLRIDTRTGATVGAITLPHGMTVGGLAVDPARSRLYVAASGAAGSSAFEYGARSGRLLAANSHHPFSGPCAGCAALTAVPGGVWASFRTGTEGLSELLAQRSLGIASTFGWGQAQAATTVYGGGALWLATNDGAIACIAPSSGTVRHQTTLAQLRYPDLLMAVDAPAHEVYAHGTHGVIAITPPPSCWA